MGTYYNNITISKNYIITTSDIAIEPKQSLGDFMFTRMKKHKDLIAQIDAETGQKYTFEKLLQSSIRTALHMSDKKITHEHLITLCTTNHLNASVPYIAAQFLGAKIGNIDPSFSRQEMDHLLNTVRPKMIFTIPESVPTIEKVLNDIALEAEIIVFGHTDKHTEFVDFLEPHQNEANFKPVEVENLKDTAAIYFSSGTTGLPKGICLSHYSLVGHILNAQSTDNEDKGLKMLMAKRVSFPITHLCYTSLYWLSAGSSLLGSINEGYCRLICDEFDGKKIWNLIEKYKPLILILTPIQVIEMLANKRDDVDKSCIVAIAVIGSAISKEYTLKLQNAFPEADIHRAYGQTEVCGPVTLFKPLDKVHREFLRNSDKVESVGLPVKGTSYRVVDIETNQNLGPNQKGELRLKSVFLMNGYYNKDSSDTFDEDGWLKTGDIVYYDEDFCFYVVDRIKEAFKYRGWFITPTVLENELSKHPAVKLAVVVGIPKEDGHLPMGLVILNHGFEVTEKEIEKFVEERVSERQRLRAGVKFIKSIPLTVTGKVNRRKLRDMVLEGKV